MHAASEDLCLPGGSVLFEIGAPADAIYFVLSGSLGVVAEPAAEGRLVARIAAGEAVGEMGLLSDRPRSATVVALRDTHLARLSRSAFDQVLRSHPTVLRALGGLVALRLEQALRGERPRLATRAVAIVPLHPGAAAAELAQGLLAALRARGRRVHRFDAHDARQEPDVFHAAEAAHDLTIYEGGAEYKGETGAAWNAFCLRRADRVLLAASGLARPPDQAPGIPPWRVRELVLLHPPDAAWPAPAGPWLRHVAVDAHYHLRRGNAADLARLARHLTGEAVGLVLSGGGARGYAHLGVVRALREAGIPIDLVGGTSFGAVVAAGVALEWDDDELRARFHEAFARSNPIRDWAWPAVALTRGHEVMRRLRQHFGDAQMEDLWRPCYAVACNLAQGKAVARREGLVAAALRASVAIPGLLPPWVLDGELFVDGGLLNNLPVDVMAGLGQGPVLAVDVAQAEGEGPARRRPQNRLRRLMVGHEYEGQGIASLLLRSATLGSAAQIRAGHNQATLVLAPPLSDVGLLDWKSLDRAIAAGYRSAQQSLDAIRRVVAP